MIVISEQELGFWVFVAFAAYGWITRFDQQKRDDAPFYQPPDKYEGLYKKGIYDEKQEDEGWKGDL